jgi:hypothetical protein
MRSITLFFGWFRKKNKTEPKNNPEQAVSENQ